MARNRDEILNEMLGNLPNTYDKNEGSVIRDLLSPCAIYGAKRESTDEGILNNAFFETADYQHKIIIAKERANIEPKPAGFAYGNVTITGAPGTIVSAGTTVASDVLLYDVTENSTIGAGGTAECKVRCREAGRAGNIPAGAIKAFPVTIEGLTSVTNAAAFDTGYDAESIEDLSKRYYLKVRNPGTSGNPAHYRNWAMEVDGVGDAKAFGRTPNRGSVTVYIIDSNKTGASAQLVKKVQEHIDVERPYPANVLVCSAQEVAINVSVTIVLNAGDTKNYTEEIKKYITGYLTSIAFLQNYVSYARVSDAILNIPGIVDISNLTVNGSTTNVQTTEYTQVAVMGGVVIA